ncbi:unnamed protein product [Caenorhabditis sp. 36 PRJEB53466]|nr:unnamed protein product [Caenorhabditis sp. 36 PRJEB53466]
MNKQLKASRAPPISPVANQHHAQTPPFSSSFRTNPPNVNKWRKLNRSCLDKDVLEGATESILKIVHPGSSEQSILTREKDRNRIREHILRTMKAPERPSTFGRRFLSCNHPTNPIDIISEMQRRRKAKPVELRKSRPLMEGLSDELRVAPTTVKTVSTNFVFQPPEDIIKETLRQKQQPKICKQVTFHSPEEQSFKVPVTSVSCPTLQESLSVKFSVECDAFSTPSRPHRSEVFSQPPPLYKIKRANYVMANEKSEIPLASGVPRPESRREMSKLQRSPDFSTADFEFEFDSQVQSKQSDPYEIFGLKPKDTNHSIF